MAQPEFWYAVLNSDGLEIKIIKRIEYRDKLIIQPSKIDKFVDMKVGTDRLFVYTLNNFIQFYYFPSD